MPSLDASAFEALVPIAVALAPPKARCGHARCVDQHADRRNTPLLPVTPSASQDAALRALRSYRQSHLASVDWRTRAPLSLSTTQPHTRHTSTHRLHTRIHEHVVDLLVYLALVRNIRQCVTKQQRDALLAAMVRGVDQRRVAGHVGRDVGINARLCQQKFHNGVHVVG